MSSEVNVNAPDKERDTGPARPPGRRRAGRGQLSKREIVQAALDVLGEAGIEGFTLRRLGKVLDVDATAFYRHFPDKSALLRAVVRACLAEIEIPVTGSGVSWEEWVLGTRAEYRSLLAERPYLVPLVLDPVVTWTSLPAYDEERQLMREVGFAEESIRPVLDAIDSFVIGSAMVVSVVGRSESAARARALPRTVSPTQARFEFELGLRALLRGLRAELGVDS